MAGEPRNLEHLFPESYGTDRRYRAPGGGSPAVPPVRDRRTHGYRLRERLEGAIEDALSEARVVGVEEAIRGTFLTFRAAPGYDLPLERLESAKRGLEVVRVQTVDGAMEATVFVPAGAEDVYRGKIEEYLTGQTPRGNPKHRSLIAGVEDIEAASLQRLWSSDPARFPAAGEVIWWEVWVRKTAWEEFDAALPMVDLDRVSGQRFLEFPDRLVTSLRGTPEQIDRLRYLSGAIAEVRHHLETPSFFVDEETEDQKDWSDDLVDRTLLPGDSAPAVCVLDTGVNRDHPLLAPILTTTDWHTVKPAWPRADNRMRAHGTAMAGLAAYGDLQAALESTSQIALPHCLESVRILPPGPTPNPPGLYGAITQDAVGQAELAAPDRRRIFCMAVTSDPSDGRPSSWSAAVDDLAAGKLDEHRRLFVVSAGNIASPPPCTDHLWQCAVTPSQDPAQAWNALVVGACTFLQTIDEPSLAGWTPVAPPGELSPYSTTSLTWSPKWPVRPDVVFEGGNMAADPSGRTWDTTTSLSLLTTHHSFATRLFDTIHATSAATAQVAALAGACLSQLPDCWPETVRALIVHSAEWPAPVAAKFDAVPGKTERGRLLRQYGFGVPDMGRMLASARNDVTIVVENEMPVIDGAGKMTSAHFYDLPWTAELLRDLGETPVSLRVTLSYFVEANPAERGWKGRYRYPSHGFRFHLQRPLESPAAFLGRINVADRDDWDGPEGGEDGWVLGPNQRNRGSLHSDTWKGPAVDLAAREKLAVVPVGGWWKSPQSRERTARYSLVVSLHSPEADVDLYTPIRNRLATLATLPTVVRT